MRPPTVTTMPPPTPACSDRPRCGAWAVTAGCCVVVCRLSGWLRVRGATYGWLVD